MCENLQLYRPITKSVPTASMGSLSSDSLEIHENDISNSVSGLLFFSFVTRHNHFYDNAVIHFFSKTLELEKSSVFLLIYFLYRATNLFLIAFG